MTPVNAEKLVQLQECEELFNALVENMLDGVVIVDWDGTIQFVNNAAANMLGLFSRGEAVGRRPADFLHPNCVERALREMGMVKEGKGDFLTSYQLLVDGNVIDVESHGAEVQYKGKSADMLVFRDVTDREHRKAELEQLNEALEARIQERTRALKESEAYYRSLHDNTSDAVFIYDVTPDNRFKFAGINPAEEKVLGLTNDDVKNKYVETIYPADISNRVILNYQKCVDEKATIAYEEDVVLSDELKHFYTRLIPVKNDEGAVIRIIGIAQDITKSRRAQKALEESEERYRAIFETTGTGTIIFDDDAIIRLANEEWSSLVGYRREEMLGKMSFMDFIAKDALPQIIENHQQRSIDPSSVPRAVETQVRDRNGKVHVGIATVGLVPGTKMRVASFLDLTELKRAQRQMYQADKMAALGQIIAGVAHEINNPNNFIYFNLPILRRYLETIKEVIDREIDDAPEMKILGMAYDAFWDDTSKLLENMEHGSSRITSIVADLKSYVRSDEDTQMKPEFIKPVIDRVMTLVGKQVRKMVKHFDVEMEEQLPEIMMNAGKIEQVLINLIINAGQAADKKDSFVKLNARRGDGNILIDVSDNGAGIPDANLEQIFEPFFTSKSRDTGTGLGLSISQKIVEDHGGTITVETTPGSGTCFTVSLPIH